MAEQEFSYRMRRRLRRAVLAWGWGAVWMTLIFRGYGATAPGRWVGWINGVILAAAVLGLFWGWSRALPDGRSWHNRLGVNMGLLLCPGLNVLWGPVVLVSLIARSRMAVGFRRIVAWSAALAGWCGMTVALAAWWNGVEDSWPGWLWGASMLGFYFGAVLPLSRWAAQRNFMPMRPERRKRFWTQLALTVALGAFLPWSVMGLWWCRGQWRMLYPGEAGVKIEQKGGGL